MEEINLKELFRFFVSKFKFIIIVAELCLIFGFIYVKFIQVPMYRSSTTLILANNKENQNSASLQSEVVLNKNLIATYSEIVKSRAVLSEVIAELDLKEDVGSLSGRVSVSLVENTQILKIQAVDKDNKKAQKIADTTAKAFMKQVQKLYKLENVAIVDEANLAGAPYNINLKRQLVIFVGAGVVGSMGLLFLIFYFDTTIKTSNDIESKLDLPVFGNIPLSNKKGE